MSWRFCFSISPRLPRFSVSLSRLVFVSYVYVLWIQRCLIVHVKRNYAKGACAAQGSTLDMHHCDGRANRTHPKSSANHWTVRSSQ